MELVNHDSFFQGQLGKMFYVGFLKSAQAWFPLCVVGDSDDGKLDTLVLASSLKLMDITVKSFAQRISHIHETFVQYLTMEEIQNIMGKYSLEKIAMVQEDFGSGCGCGCGCS